MKYMTATNPRIPFDFTKMSNTNDEISNITQIIPNEILIFHSNFPLFDELCFDVLLSM